MLSVISYFVRLASEEASSDKSRLADSTLLPPKDGVVVFAVVVDEVFLFSFLKISKSQFILFHYIYV
jgi:hypothetical protein